jgi:hypothetical protein
MWQASTGDANLRFSRGFFNLTSFNVGIDGTDDKFKISSSKNNIIAGLDDNTIIEIDHSKEVNFKGDVTLDPLAGSGTRNLKIRNDGQVIADEQFGYHSIHLGSGTYFNDDAFQTISLDLPHGAVIKEIKFVFQDNNSGILRFEMKRSHLLNANNFLDDFIYEFTSADYPESPNYQEVVLSGIDISFPIIDNQTYSYTLTGFGQGSSREFQHMIIKYSW